jgi:hypothetical protein
MCVVLLSIIQHVYRPKAHTYNRVTYSENLPVHVHVWNHLFSRHGHHCSNRIGAMVSFLLLPKLSPAGGDDNTQEINSFHVKSSYHQSLSNIYKWQCSISFITYLCIGTLKTTQQKSKYRSTKLTFFSFSRISLIGRWAAVTQRFWKLIAKQDNQDEHL